MGTFFAGLGVSFALLAVVLRICRQAKRTSDAKKKGNYYRAAAFFALAASACAVGTNFQTFATGLASHLPGPLVGFAAMFCGLGVYFDCIGKENYAGRSTVTVAAFVPLLLVTAPLAVFGIDLGQAIREVKSTVQDAGVIKTSGRN